MFRVNKWFCTDDDCCQYMKETPYRWEMIELLWLDTTNADRTKGCLEYVVVHGWVFKEELTEEDAEYAYSTYGYEKDSIDERLVAECRLEAELLYDEFVIFQSNERKEAEDFIKKYIMEDENNEADNKN